MTLNSETGPIRSGLTRVTVRGRLTAALHRPDSAVGEEKRQRGGLRTVGPSLPTVLSPLNSAIPSPGAGIMTGPRPLRTRGGDDARPGSAGRTGPGHRRED